MMQPKKGYVILARCENCLNTRDAVIPQGTLIQHWPCGICGCYMLNRSPNATFGVEVAMCGALPLVRSDDDLACVLQAGHEGPHSWAPQS